MFYSLNFLTLREERRLRVFENRILTRILGLKMHDNVQWRRLHSKELHILYRSPKLVTVIKFRRLRWAEHVDYCRDYVTLPILHEHFTSQMIFCSVLYLILLFNAFIAVLFELDICFKNIFYAYIIR